MMYSSFATVLGFILFLRVYVNRFILLLLLFRILVSFEGELGVGEVC